MPRASAAPSTTLETKQRPLVRNYSREDLAKIFALYEGEEVSGATPRYIEDVKVGDKLKTMVKGPLTVTGFLFAFAQGWGGLYIRSANKLAWKQMQKHPGLGIANKFGIPDVPGKSASIGRTISPNSRWLCCRLRLRSGALLLDDPSSN